MEGDTKALLFDIVDSCWPIEELVATMHFDEYEASDVFWSAVERQFINIGEALN